jgi:phage terminase Nu1 subunit (DNA packaging protein)
MSALETVSKAELAELFGKEERTVTNWRQQGIPVRINGKSVRYPLGPCIAWYVDRERETARTGKGPSELDVVRIRKTLAEARRAELEVEELEGALIRMEMHEDRVRRLCDRLAARCKTLTRFAGDVQTALTDAEALGLCEKIETDLLRSLSETADDVEEDQDEPAAAGAPGESPAS